MNKKKLKKPPKHPILSHGSITNIRFEDRITSVTNGYAFRFYVTLADGTVVKKQRGPFKTKRECSEMRNEAIIRTPQHAFAVFDKITVMDTFLYWLYYYKIDQEEITSYNTFISYRNIIENYIIPFFGKTKVSNVTYEMIMDFFSSITKQNILKNCICIIKMGFEFAQERYLLYHNPAMRACSDKKAAINLEKKHYPKKQRPTLTIEQAKFVLSVCKKEMPDFFILLAFSITMGLRINEIIAVKYSDINYSENYLMLQRQLGKKLEFEEDSSEAEADEVESSYYNINFLLHNDQISADDPDINKLYHSQELAPKSINGIRKIPIPPLLMQAILEQQDRYFQNRAENPDFEDHGYICCHKDGRPFNDTCYLPYFKPLLKMCGLEGFTFHDMRHTYATILFDNDISVKAISKVMGHSKASTTYNVYIEKHLVAYDVIPFLQELINNLLPKPKIFDIVFLDTTINALI